MSILFATAMTLATTSAAEAPRTPHAFLAGGGVGGAGTSTFGGGMVAAVEALIRVYYVNVGGTLDFATTTDARATAFGGMIGPTFPLSGVDLDLLAIVGHHAYEDVGAYSTRKSFDFLGPGCGSDGASASSGYLGSRIGVSTPARARTRTSFGAYLYYRRDLSPTDVTYRSTCSDGFTLFGPDNSRSWDTTRTVGGQEVGAVFRVAVLTGF